MSNKKKVKIDGAFGKYLAEDVVTGETVILSRGAFVNEMTLAALQSNGITEVLVSDVLLTGENKPKSLVWKCVVEHWCNEQKKDKKSVYFVIEQSPTQAENLLTCILETKIEGTFRLVSVVPFEKCRHAIFRINDEESYSGHKPLVWYNVIYNFINYEGDAGYENSMLIQTNDILRIRKIIQRWLDENKMDKEWEVVRIVDTKAVDVIQPERMDMFRFYDL